VVPQKFTFAIKVYITMCNSRAKSKDDSLASSDVTNEPLNIANFTISSRPVPLKSGVTTIQRTTSHYGTSRRHHSTQSRQRKKQETFASPLPHSRFYKPFVKQLSVRPDNSFPQSFAHTSCDIEPTWMPKAVN